MISLKMNALCIFKNMPEQKKCKFLQKNCRKVWKLKKSAYLCNPKTNKAVVVKW